MCCFPLYDQNTGWDNKCYTQQYKYHCDGHPNIKITNSSFITLLTCFNIPTSFAASELSLCIFNIDGDKRGHVWITWSCCIDNGASIGPSILSLNPIKHYLSSFVRVFDYWNFFGFVVWPKAPSEERWRVTVWRTMDYERVSNRIHRLVWCQSDCGFVRSICYDKWSSC